MTAQLKEGAKELSCFHCKVTNPAHQRLSHFYNNDPDEINVISCSLKEGYLHDESVAVGSNFLVNLRIKS